MRGMEFLVWLNAFLSWSGWQGITGLIALIALAIAVLALVESIGDRYSNIGRSWAIHRESRRDGNGQIVTIEFRAAGPAHLYEVGMSANGTMNAVEDIEVEPLLTAGGKGLTGEFIVRTDPQRELPRVVVTWATVRYGRPRTHHLELTQIQIGERVSLRYARKPLFGDKLRWRPMKQQDQ